MTKKEEQLKRDFEEKFTKQEKLSKADQEKLRQQHEKQTSELTKMHQQLRQDMEIQQIKNQKQQEKLKRIIEKKNYEDHYPVPLFLSQHKIANPDSFYIQILGCRGAGKSTFINKLLKKAKMKDLAVTGVNETTKETKMFDITDRIMSLPPIYKKVFLCDQPCIGGLEIQEAGYLAKFGPGYFKLII